MYSDSKRTTFSRVGVCFSNGNVLGFSQVREVKFCVDIVAIMSVNCRAGELNWRFFGCASKAVYDPGRQHHFFIINCPGKDMFSVLLKYLTSIIPVILLRVVLIT